MRLGNCVLLFFHVIFSQVYARNLQGCRLDVWDTGNEKNLPLLLHNYTTHFRLAIPEKGSVVLNTGDTITFACTGKNNFLTETNSNITHFICVQNSTLRIGKKQFDFSNLRCKKQIRGDVRKPKKECARNKGDITEIGYQITKKDWVTLIKVCYDENAGVTFYTAHSLHGNEIKYAAKFVDRPGFSTEGLGSNITASVSYKKSFQKSTFNKLLGSATIARRFINNKSYLARGHLAPDADFLTTATKRASYYFINATPQWQAINGGNWKSIEISIRKNAEKNNHTLTVITGTHGVLSLPDVNNNLVPIYLVPKEKLPVPQFVWKIVYEEETKKGIVIISINNPFVGKVSRNDLLCKDICDEYGWGAKNLKDTSRGFIYCCEVESFQESVPYSPVLNVTGVLLGKSCL